MLAGGSGTRVGAGINKAFLQLSGRSIAAWGLNTLASVEGVGILVFVVRPEDLEHARFVEARETDVPLEIIPGGDTRQESELAALRHLADRIDSGAVDTVLIHDAARPLVSHGLASAVLHAAREHGGAVPGIPAVDIAPVAPGERLAGPGEQGTGAGDPGAGPLVRVQTPQGFHAATILDAYEAAARDGFVGTDTASCAEAVIVAADPAPSTAAIGHLHQAENVIVSRSINEQYQQQLQSADFVILYTSNECFTWSNRERLQE